MALTPRIDGRDFSRRAMMSFLCNLNILWNYNSDERERAQHHHTPINNGHSTRNILHSVIFTYRKYSTRFVGQTGVVATAQTDWTETEPKQKRFCGQHRKPGTTFLPGRNEFERERERKKMCTEVDVTCVSFLFLFAGERGQRRNCKFYYFGWIRFSFPVCRFG